jgi:hypothetical protein
VEAMGRHPRQSFLLQGRCRTVSSPGRFSGGGNDRKEVCDDEGSASNFGDVGSRFPGSVSGVMK